MGQSLPLLKTGVSILLKVLLEDHDWLIEPSTRKPDSIGLKPSRTLAFFR